MIQLQSNETRKNEVDNYSFAHDSYGNRYITSCKAEKCHAENKFFFFIKTKLFWNGSLTYQHVSFTVTG